MKNEVLEEIWNIKNQIGKENGYDINRLIGKLRRNQKNSTTRVVNLSKQKKDTVQ